MAPRSRTGCLTCRQRKLKCSEERPICSQCHKAKRECIPSSGITFRHQQNPSMNGDPVSRESLKSFYGYKETFGQESVWVPVPATLKFITTTNPYEDEENAAPSDDALGSSTAQNAASYESNKTDSDFAAQLAQAAYPSYATHGLEALSAVASQDQYNYAPPPAPMNSNESPQQSYQPTSSPLQDNATVAQQLDYILNGQHDRRAQSNAPAPGNSNIDPRLGSVENGTPDHHAEQQHEHQHEQLEQHQPAPAPEYPPAAPAQPPPQGTLHVRTHSYTSVRPPSLLSKGTTRSSAPVRNAELAFLMRDYSERAGAWMDLFDLSQFFATQVPVLAVRCPLLLYSCAALSAKSLARVAGRKPVMNGQVTSARMSRMETWPGMPLDAQGWERKGRENYDLAVSLLRQALAGATRPSTSSLPSDATAEEVRIVQEAALPDTDSDELVAATAILCVYEFLDASGPEWSRHLDGAKTLFEVAKDRMVPLTLPPSPVSLSQQIHDHIAGRPSLSSSKARKGPSHGRTAVFWNFARQDMLSAFINNACTRLDTNDIPMWKSAGLKLTPDGYLCPSNLEHPDYNPENAMKDDIISNALIWILMKLVNFMAAGDGTPCPLGLGVRQHNLLEQWNELDRQLRVWYEGLPNSFSPTAIVPTLDQDGGIEEKWFPRSMCASTMQSYHFARIQLLHNKPHISTATPMTPSTDGIDPTARLGTPGSSLAARNASYASILHQSRFHAKEIVAIDLGRGDEGTRIHSVQPLWTAGLVLGAGPTSEFLDDMADAQVDPETEMWRQTIIRLLRGIEHDMGWASQYRVDSLLGLWRLPDNWGLESELG